MVESCKQGGKFYVFGTGHSHMIAEGYTCEVVDKLVKEGIEPPIFKSSNVDGGDEHNHAMFEKYYGYWK